MGKLEVEVHHEGHEHHDPLGKQVGVLAAVLAVGLAVVTIGSHRTHTAAIMHKTTANDGWSFYQAERIKFYVLDVGQNMLASADPKGHIAESLAKYDAQKKKYDSEANQAQVEARKNDELAEADERRAIRYDLGEGLLEIGLVLTSLFFIARRKMFPVLGLIAGISGSVIAVTGLMV